MKPRKIDNRWYIEVETKELGKVLLLDGSGLPVPMSFDYKKEAENYIKHREANKQ